MKLEVGLLESNNIKEAVEAVEAMAVAPTGSGWLCVPSYVVISIDMSSKHLCTYNCKPKKKKIWGMKTQEKLAN